MSNLDSISEQIDNTIMDDSMRLECVACNKTMGYMNSALFRSGTEYNWILCEDCFRGIVK